MSEWTPNSDDLQSLTTAKQVFKQGNTHDEVVKLYTEWVKDGKYMEDTDPVRYRAHILACEELENYFPTDRDKVKVIDIGAGTGRCAPLLIEKGFRLLDALEPCEEMLDEARKLNLYRNYISKPIGFQKLPIEDNTYDLAVVSGAMGEGHIPCEGLHEMARIVRPGGLISISMRQEFMDDCTDYRGRLEPLMEKMVADGEWRVVSRHVRPDYYCHKPGLVLKFSPC